MNFYAVPVCSLYDFRTDWRVVIADSDIEASEQVVAVLGSSEYVAQLPTVKWLGPAHLEDGAA